MKMGASISVILFIVLIVCFVKVIYTPTKITGKAVSIENINVRGSIDVIVDTGDRVRIEISSAKELNEISALAGKHVTIITNKYGHEKESEARFIKVIN